MESILISSGTKQKRNDAAFSLCEKYAIASVDITVFDKDAFEEKSSKATESALGISLVRAVQKRILLSPFAGKKQAIILADAQLLTLPAQHALLKTLEEPPEHTVLILTCSSKETLLPTLLSRCLLITLKDSGVEALDTRNQRFVDYLKHFKIGNVGQQMELASELAKEQDAKIAVKDFILQLRIKLIEAIQKKSEDQKALHSLLSSFCRAHVILQTSNVAPRSVLEHCLFSKF